MGETLFKYRVIGKNTLIAHNGEDLREGDELELPKHVAVNFRGQLEATDEAGAFDDTSTDHGALMASMENMRDHEREQVLSAQKEKLEKQLDSIDAELERIQAGRRTASAPSVPAKTPAAQEGAVKKKG